MNGAISFAQLTRWRDELDSTAHPLVVTNGCFDLLHVGHVRYLRQAAELGKTLLVGINDDVGIRELKGPQRPLNSAGDRQEVLLALEFVSAVCIFPGSRATNFLKAARPDIYAKGGDYTVGDLYAPEREVLEAADAEIRILPLVPGKSTTSLIEKGKAS